MKVKFIGSGEYWPDLTIGKVYTSEWGDCEIQEGGMVCIVEDVGDRTALYSHEYEVVEE